MFCILRIIVHSLLFPETMRSIITLSLLFFGLCVTGQTVTPTVLSNNGDYATSSGGSIEWTIGEPVSDTYIKTTNITTNGFHQTSMELFAMIREKENAGNLLVFPNPVKNELKISFGGLPGGNYSLTLYDALGKLILSSDVNVSENNYHTLINLTETAAGNYFLKIEKENFLETVKINKVH
jgi:hypothetical protein